MSGNGGAQANPSKTGGELQVNEPEVSLNQPVTHQALLQSWKAYATSIEKSNPRLFSILNNHLPTLENGITVKLELRNPIQEGEVLKEKNALFTFLKNQLKNTTLELETFINTQETDTSSEVFTASDKLKVMMEKNPVLAKLKQQFNLDLD